MEKPAPQRITPTQQAFQSVKALQQKVVRPILHQVKPKESTEDLATDYLLASLALLEEADKHSHFKTTDIQVAIEYALEQKANYMQSNKL